LGQCILDQDSDGVCDEFEIVGCEDVIACNFNSSATDSGICIYAQPYYSCQGICINDMDGDGVCNELEILGCLDSIACNFNPMATQAGSCTYALTYYTCDGACLMDQDMDGVCDQYELSGCLDPAACNYEPNATDSAGCIYLQLFYNCDGTCMNDADLDGICDELEISGCNDSLACNYNPLVTEIDNSCIYPIDEICNDFDDDCNGVADDGLVFSDWFTDQDLDGFGDLFYDNNCGDLAIGYSFISGDCNDLDISINPIALEIPDNNIDENCDGDIPNEIDMLEWNDLSIFPNPTNGWFQIEGVINPGIMEIFNTQGVLMMSVAVQKNERIQLDALSNGLYVVRFGNYFTQRIMLSK
jgi:hypothetical protein